MLELAILGVLKERPMHGYELKKRLSYLLGHFWQVSYGSLYPALKRLDKNGAVKKNSSEKTKSKKKFIYEITSVGEEMFERDVKSGGSVSDIENADRFNIRLAFFSYTDPELRIWLLERRRNYLIGKIEEMQKSQTPAQYRTDKYRSGIFRHKVEIAQADIKWLNELIERERMEIGAAASSNAEEDKGKNYGRDDRPNEISATNV